MSLAPLDTPNGRALVRAGGTIESGMIANMRTYLLPVDPKRHVRILGMDRTLCGRSLVNNDQWAWQFCARGNVVEGRVPGYMIKRGGCAQCLSSPFMQVTLRIAEERRQAMLSLGKHKKRALATLS